MGFDVVNKVTIP